MDNLETKLSQVESALTKYVEKAAEERKTLGTALDETKSTIDNLQKQFDAIVLEMKKPANPAAGEKTLADELKENEQVQRLMRDRTGRAVITIGAKHYYEMLERKTTITSSAVGAATSGVLGIDRLGGITEEARRPLVVRDALSSRPTTQQVIDFVKVNASMVSASPQVEAAAKFENAVTFTTASQTVRTIATWIPATKQILEDFSELNAFLMSSLPYYVNIEEEEQLLSGDNTGENLNGLITQAQAYDTTLNNATVGWTKLDILGRCIQQVAIDNEPAPTFAIVHPKDFWDLALTKDGEGRYFFGGPQGGPPTSLWTLQRIIPTTAITSGTFLVGNGTSVCAEICDRAGMTVEISTEHSDYFVKNMVAIRAEKRLALVVRRPNAFVKGTFTQSPA